MPHVAPWPPVDPRPPVAPRPPADPAPAGLAVSALPAAQLTASAPRPNPAHPNSAQLEHHLGATNSPWSNSGSIDASALPSAAFDIPAMASAAAEAPLAPAPAPASPGRSRGVLTILLALLAVVLVAVLAFLTFPQRTGGDDPAEVNAGQSQRDYVFDGAPTASSTANTGPQPPPRPRAPPKPKATSDDPYADL
ncbi:MAG: hypothetical protein EXR75_05045 [Myxococcales bacterium]|nr:hypothetical protein [Myxococcales bacterium]